MRVEGPHHYKVTALGSSVKWPLTNKTPGFSYVKSKKMQEKNQHCDWCGHKLWCTWFNVAHDPPFHRGGAREATICLLLSKASIRVHAETVVIGKTIWTIDQSCQFHKFLILRFVKSFPLSCRRYNLEEAEQCCALCWVSISGHHCNERGEPTASWRWIRWVWEIMAAVQDFSKTSDHFRECTCYSLRETPKDVTM